MALVKREPLKPDVKVEGGAEKATPEPPKTKAQKVEDFSLALELENCKAVRTVLREEGALIRWPSKEFENVYTLECIGLNIGVMSVVAQHHCSKNNVVKAPQIDFLKAQAWVVVYKLVYCLTPYPHLQHCLVTAANALHTLLPDLAFEKHAGLQVEPGEDPPGCMDSEEALLILDAPHWSG